MALISLPRAPLHYDVRDQSELRRLIEFLSNQVEQLLSATGVSAGGGSLTVDDEGVAQGTATTLDFVGAGVTASVAGNVATVTISGGGSGVDTQDEGVFIGTATTLDFVGGGVTATFGAGTTTVTVPTPTTTATETEVDFGTTPVYTAQFAVVDAAIGAGSKVLISESGKAATGRVAGDAEWDSIAVAALPAAGAMTVYATAHPGPVVGKRKLHYLVAT